MDKMREDFEAWWRCNGGMDAAPDEIEFAFDIWKASRAALRVELPNESSIWWHQDVCESLEEAGVPYK